jgi:hypothetical protein
MTTRVLFPQPFQAAAFSACKDQTPQAEACATEACATSICFAEIRIEAYRPHAVSVDLTGASKQLKLGRKSVWALDSNRTSEGIHGHQTFGKE